MFLMGWVSTEVFYEHLKRKALYSMYDLDFKGLRKHFKTGWYL